MTEKGYSRLNTTIETNRTFVMMPKILDLVFDESDPKGNYRVIGTFKDLNSGSRSLSDTLIIRLI